METATETLQRPILDRVPLEVFCQIVEQLSTDDFKALRLSSHTIADITRPYLALPTFHSSSRRDDDRLEELASIPACAGRIRCLELNLSGTEFEISEPSRAPRRTLLLSDLAVFFATLPNLHGLRELSLKWAGQQEDPSTVLERTRVQLAVDCDRKCVNSLQRDLLRRFAELAVSIKVMEVDPSDLLQSLWVVGKKSNDLKIETFEGLFGSLRKLDLTTKHTQFGGEPKRPSWVAELLSKTPLLRHLRLNILSRPQVVNGGYISLFGDVHLKHLECLEVVNALHNLPNFKAFLERHAGTLRTLHLESPNMSEKGQRDGKTTLEELCYFIRDDLKLETVRIRGFVRQLWKWEENRHKNEMIGLMVVAVVIPERMIKTQDEPEFTEMLEKFLMKLGPYPDNWPWSYGPGT